MVFRKDTINERRKIWKVVSEILEGTEIEQHDRYGMANCGFVYVVENILPKYGITIVED